MNYSMKNYVGDRLYDSYDEYLGDLKMYVVILLRDYIVRTYGGAPKGMGQKGAVLPEYGEVVAMLHYELAKKGIDEDQEVGDWYGRILSRRELSQISGQWFPVDGIRERMELGEFGDIVIPLALLGTLSKGFERVFCFLERDPGAKHPTLELCARLYCREEASELQVNQLVYGHALKLQLLFPELAEAENLVFGRLVCDERLADLIFGKTRYYTRGVTVREAKEALDPLYHREEELKKLLRFDQEEELPIFVLCGERGSGKKHLVRHYAKSCPKVYGRGRDDPWEVFQAGQERKPDVVYFDVKGFYGSGPTDMDAVLTALRFAGREAFIHSYPLAVTGVEVMAREELEQMLSFIEANLKDVVRPVFLLMDGEGYTSGLEGLYIVLLRALTELERIELWRYYTRDCRLEEGLNLEEVANTFLITPGQIIGAIRQASLLSERGAPLQEKTLYQACYAQLDHKLATKSRKVNSDFLWEDLKLPDSDKTVLRDLCNCIRNKHIVMNEWNFSKVIPYGAGITVLFSGPPGTGKTMAAQVIANELKMELYKIDLSQVIDKYVGETEKNIRHIFDQAKKSNSILFFDEADAIFNKRLEASSSNDRFANIESSLLLQCVEEYSGISILATNNMTAIDAAFIRRFKYYILFREPGEEVRYEIWKSVIPQEAPLSEDVDLRVLARQFQFTGAVIKNVVISSAYLAAEKGEAISLIDILVSIKREMFKNNLILTKEKLGSLGYLFEDIK